MWIKLMRINFLSSVNANLMRIKLMLINVMRIKISSVNAPLHLLFLSSVNAKIDADQVDADKSDADYRFV